MVCNDDSVRRGVFSNSINQAEEFSASVAEEDEQVEHCITTLTTPPRRRRSTAHFISVSSPSSSSSPPRSPWTKDARILAIGERNTNEILASSSGRDQSPVNCEIAKRVARYRSLGRASAPEQDTRMVSL